MFNLVNHFVVYNVRHVDQKKLSVSWHENYNCCYLPTPSPAIFARHSGAGSSQDDTRRSRCCDRVIFFCNGVKASLDYICRWILLLSNDKPVIPITVIISCLQTILRIVCPRLLFGEILLTWPFLFFFTCMVRLFPIIYVVILLFVYQFHYLC